MGDGRRVSALGNFYPTEANRLCSRPFDCGKDLTTNKLGATTTIMSMKEIITAKLTAALSPASLDVIDESENHRGHGGWREGGETHFRVRIVADAFSGMNRVGRHRAINDVLATELNAGVHALAIEARAPNEADPRAERVSDPS